jgi:hypothetical protein
MVDGLCAIHFRCKCITFYFCHVVYYIGSMLGSSLSCSMQVLLYAIHVIYVTRLMLLNVFSSKPATLQNGIVLFVLIESCQPDMTSMLYNPIEF